MPDIRVKVTPVLTPEGLIHVTLEWVELENLQVQRVLASEEFEIAQHRAGCAYVSHGSTSEMEVLPNFYLDEQGLRHFTLLADTGVVPITGQSVELVPR